MSILGDFRDAIIELLTTDPVFSGSVNTVLGQAVTNALKTNTPLGEIPATLYPCWVLEQGAGNAASISNKDATIHTIGLSMQTFQVRLGLALVWVEQDREAAADQRAALPELLTQLMLRNPQPSGVDGATLTAFTPDGGVNHPAQIWQADIMIDVTIPQ